MLSRPRPASKPISRAVRKTEDVSGGFRQAPGTKTHSAARFQPAFISAVPPPSSRLLALHVDSSKSIYSLCLSPTLAFSPRLLSLPLSSRNNKGAGNPAANASLLDGSATEAAPVRRGKAMYFPSFFFFSLALGQPALLCLLENTPSQVSSGCTCRVAKPLVSG